MLTDEFRQVLEEQTTHRPFDCDRAFVFAWRDGELEPLDSEGRDFLARNALALSRIGEPVEDVPGTLGILEETPEHVVYVVSCRLADSVVVAAKQVQKKDGGSAPCPFDAYYIKALAASLNSLSPTLYSAVSAAGMNKDEVYVCIEPAAYKRFGEQWRSIYGRDKWLAVKGAQVRAYGDSREEAERQLDAAGVEPPTMLVPPEADTEPVDMADYECR